MTHYKNLKLYIKNGYTEVVTHIIENNRRYMDDFIIFLIT